MASGGGDARSLRVESYVRGYHVYQRIWNPFMGEVALAVREEGNVHDRLWIPGWFVLLLALLTVTIVIDHYYDLSRSPRTVLRLFLGWLCRRIPADWQRLVYTLEKLRDFASAGQHSYLLLEIFHTGTNEGIILIMRHIEWFFNAYFLMLRHS